MSERYRLGCRPTYDVDGEDQLEDRCGQFAPRARILDHEHTIPMKSICLAISYSVLLTIHKDDFYSCLIFLSQGLI